MMEDLALEQFEEFVRSGMILLLLPTLTCVPFVGTVFSSQVLINILKEMK
jgi:hypothetical protein